MKYIVCCCGIVLVLLMSCSKQTGTSNNFNMPLSIVGNWNVIRDSIYEGAGVANHLVVYTGRKGDYFDFKTDGKVYIKEGPDYQTLNYQVTSDSITIDSFPGICSINLNDKGLSVISRELATPGGIMKRSVYLSK